MKEAVFPFIKFPGVDTILGPEMKSTGEVMGVGHTFAEAFVKSQLAAGVRLPKSAARRSSRCATRTRRSWSRSGRTLAGLGFALVATKGTAAALRGRRPHGAARQQGAGGPPARRGHAARTEVSLIVNTVEEDRRSVRDSWSIRNSALQDRITYYTTVSGARAACLGMQHLEEMRPYDIQSLHATIR